MYLMLMFATVMSHTKIENRSIYQVFFVLILLFLLTAILSLTVNEKTLVHYEPCIYFKPKLVTNISYFFNSQNDCSITETDQHTDTVL